MKLPARISRAFAALAPRALVSCALWLLLALVCIIACALGSCTAAPGAVAATLAVIAAGAVTALLRAPLMARLHALPHAAHVIICIALFAAGVALSFLAVDLPWNERLFIMKPRYVALNVALIALTFAALVLFAQGRGQAAGAGALVCTVLGLAEYFVYSFKDTVIRPSDLLSLETAAAVSGQYDYIVDTRALLGIACGLLAWRLLSFIAPGKRSERAEHRLRRVLVNVIVALACCVALGALCSVPQYKDDLGVDIDGWFIYDSYTSYGFIPSFIASVQDMAIEEPEGYSDESAAQTQSSYASAYDARTSSDESLQAAQEQFEELQPTVIAVMNETFADLGSLYDGLDAGYEGPEYFNSIDDALASGELTVSVIGGGTCNSEFEFITGYSYSLIGADLYPYELYDFDACESLVSQFEELGYVTSAIHPNKATNWERDEVYAGLGFDTFYDIESFEGAETYRDLVTDGATYDKILELLEQDDSPQFIFDVTMQNHSGYSTGLVPEEDELSYEPAGIDDGETNDELNEYLACIKRSDEDLEEFMAALEELDRPVVLVFFGDHQPGFAADYNDALYADEDAGMEHAARQYKTQYFVWANYDVASTQQQSTSRDTSVNYLAAETLELIGAPLSDYQKAMLEIRESMPLVNAFGYTDAAGTWHSIEDEDEHTQAYLDLMSIEYRKVSAQLLEF